MSYSHTGKNAVPAFRQERSRAGAAAIHSPEGLIRRLSKLALTPDHLTALRTLIQEKSK